MTQKRKPLMRSLGEFFGYIVKAAKSDPDPKRITVNKTVDEQDRDTMTLRRTTIDEIEFKQDQSGSSSQGSSDPASEPLSPNS